MVELEVELLQVNIARPTYGAVMVFVSIVVHERHVISFVNDGGEGNKVAVCLFCVRYQV